MASSCVCTSPLAVIGCRRTSRRRQSIHFSRIPVLFADNVYRRSGVDNNLSFLKVFDLMAQADTHFPKVRRMLFYLSPFILGYFWPTSTLLRGHIALVILSLPETDFQMLEHWDYADEEHLGKSLQPMDFGLECQHDVPQLL